MPKTFSLALLCLLCLSACKPKVDDPNPAPTEQIGKGNSIVRDSHPGKVEKSILNSDGNIVTCGEDGNAAPMLVKFSTNNGNVIWTKTYNPNEVGIFTDLAETSDGGYLICGIKKSDSGDYDVHITRVNIVGEILWKKSVGGLTDETNAHIARATGDNFVVVAAQQNTANDIFDMWITADGSQWNQTFPKSGHQVPYNVIVTDAGNTIITGVDYSTVAEPNKMYLLKLSDITLPQASHSEHINGGHTIPRHTITLTNNNLLTCGSVAHNGKVNGFVTMSNSACQTIWSMEYGSDSNMILRSVIADGSAGFKAIGVVYGNESDPASQVVMIALDMQGKERWRKRYDTPQYMNEEGTAIFPGKDGGNIVISNSRGASGSAISDQYFMMYVAEDGSIRK